MKDRCRFVLALAILALGASPAKPSVGFVDLARLVAIHPLHSVLAQYDREIAALRGTQNLPGLRDPAQTALNASAAQQRETSSARTAVASTDARSATRDRERESAAVSRLSASQHAGQAAMSDYAAALSRETNANFAAFERAMDERSTRAYAARAQQLREKETTLAFDLERQDAGRRLELQLKLDDLRLLAPARAKLRARLAELDGRELQAISAQRRRDAATLATYRVQLSDAGAAATAQMANQLREKATANFAIRRGVSAGASNANQGASLTSRLASFSASYARGADADAIDTAMRAASGDLSQNFTMLAAADRQSRRDVAAQLTTLQADRFALYRSIVAQILRTAARVARQRGLSGVDFAGKQPKASVDLTAAVTKALI